MVVVGVTPDINPTSWVMSLLLKSMRPFSRIEPRAIIGDHGVAQIGCYCWPSSWGCKKCPNWVLIVGDQGFARNAQIGCIKLLVINGVAINSQLGIIVGDHGVARNGTIGCY